MRYWLLDVIIIYGVGFQPTNTHLQNTQYWRKKNEQATYNQDGYNVRLIFTESSEELTVYLDAPEEMDEFEWPTTGLGSMLPATKSTVGDISWDNSETFIVHVGGTTIDEYKEYVKACEAEGFTMDYSKDDEYYNA